MTVDELWYELLQGIDEKSNPNGVSGKHLRKLIESPEGRGRFRRGIKEKLKQKKLSVLRLFAQIIDPSEQPGVQLSKEVRRELLEESVNVAAVFAERDAIFWRFRWLQLASGQPQITARLSQEFRKFCEGSATPGETATRFKALAGWADVANDRWVELFEKARDSEPSGEFRSHLHKVAEVLRSGGGPPPAASSVSPTLPPAEPATGRPAPSGQRAPEPPQAKTVASQPATPTAAEGDGARVPAPAAGGKPADDSLAAGGSPRVPNAEVSEKPGSEQPQAIDPPAPAGGPPQANGGVAETTGETLGLTPAAKLETSEVKEARPKRVGAKKAAGKDAAVARSRTEPAAGDSPAATGNSEQAIPPSAGKMDAAEGGDLPAVLTELTAAVRAISGRLDQIVSRTGDGASLEQRLVELERRLAGVERALTDTQSDAQRARDEVDRVRARLREREQELEDALRERATAAARSDDLARRLASADARIAAAESRADQNIHEAFRERDAAVLTFKARLWDAVQAQLSDVTDPTPGEEFASTEEEVLTTRLRNIRDTLRAEGVPP